METCQRPRSARPREHIGHTARETLINVRGSPPDNAFYTMTVWRRRGRGVVLVFALSASSLSSVHGNISRLGAVRPREHIKAGNHLSTGTYPDRRLALPCDHIKDRNLCSFKPMYFSPVKANQSACWGSCPYSPVVCVYMRSVHCCSLVTHQSIRYQSLTGGQIVIPIQHSLIYHRIVEGIRHVFLQPKYLVPRIDSQTK